MKKMNKMKKSLCILLLIVSVFCAGMAVCAQETESDEGSYQEFESIGITVKSPKYWEEMNGSVVIYPVSSTSIFDDPEVYAAFLYYVPASSEDMEDEEKVEDLMQKMTMVGMLLTVKGDKDQLYDALTTLGIGTDEEAFEKETVQVGEADGYQFFAFIETDEEYVASLEEEYAADFNNLLGLFEKELKQAQYYAPVDNVKALEGKTLSFSSKDLDGNTLTSEELFRDNEITMVNLWGEWCINCVNEMEELAEINTRLQEKGCGIVGIEWEKDPSEETYQRARDLMKEKGTNYPSVLMREGNEILGAIENFPATFFVDRDGTILTKPIIGAKATEYEPTVEALLEGVYTPETEAGDAADYTYRVFVKDEEDNPVPEAQIQFCDETTCRLGETDEDGCAEFEVSEEKTYEIHILEAPDGYAYDDEEVYSTDASSFDTTIVLKKGE